MEGRMDVGGELKRYEQGLLVGFFTSDGGLALTRDQGWRHGIRTRPYIWPSLVLTYLIERFISISDNRAHSHRARQSPACRYPVRDPTFWA